MKPKRMIDMSALSWNPSRCLGYGLLVAAALTLGCASGGDAPEAEAPADESASAPTEMPSASMETDGAPRVFFITPKDGDTVASQISMEFGIENYGVEPAGDESVHAGMGHMHIGVNTDCMDPGIVIPKADPWIHFGDGSMVIEMQLPPGETKLALQVGDGEHRTLDEPGLCEVITVTVE